ncbi:MAG TPA: porin family protein [Bacteroidetes bacterium]|nr:porin family protein [Bacteroidota bacterium]
MKKLPLSMLIVIALLTMTGLSFAQMNLGLNGVGGKLGYISPEGNIDNSVVLGGWVNLGTITPQLHLRADVEFWGKSYSDYSAKVSFTQLALGAVVLYYFPMENANFKPYSGVGLDFTRSKTSVEGLGFYSGSASSSSTDIGIDLVAGIEYPLSPNLNGRGEFKYHTDGADFWGIFVGVMYSLGK